MKTNLFILNLCLQRIMRQLKKKTDYSVCTAWGFFWRFFAASFQWLHVWLTAVLVKIIPKAESHVSLLECLDQRGSGFKQLWTGSMYWYLLHLFTQCAHSTSLRYPYVSIYFQCFQDKMNACFLWPEVGRYPMHRLEPMYAPACCQQTHCRLVALYGK